MRGSPTNKDWENQFQSLLAESVRGSQYVGVSILESVS